MSKKSVFLTDAAEALVADEASFSGRLNYLLEIGEALALDMCPALPESQWMALVAALNGHAPNYQRGWVSVLRNAWASVADSAPELNDAWGVDCVDLARRMGGLPLPQQWATLEIVRKYWGMERSACATNAAALQAAGARVEGQA